MNKIKRGCSNCEQQFSRMCVHSSAKYTEYPYSNIFF